MSAAAARQAPRRANPPQPWTLILPGHASPVAYASVDEAARRIVRLAPGMLLQFSRRTCSYPGFDTFEGLKIEGVVPGGDTRAYVGTIVATAAELGVLRAAIARAAVE